MSLMRDESFGPIIGIQKVSSEKEAIELVNDSDLGLTGGVYTKDAERYPRSSALTPRMRPSSAHFIPATQGQAHSRPIQHRYRLLELLRSRVASSPLVRYLTTAPILFILFIMFINDLMLFFHQDATSRVWALRSAWRVSAPSPCPRPGTWLPPSRWIWRASPSSPPALLACGH